MLAERSGAALATALRGWRDQLLAARSGDGLIPYGPGTQVHRQVVVHFPQALPAWTRSRQQQGTLRALAASPDLPLAAAATALLLLIAFALRNPHISALAAAAGGAVLANAAICGVLSGVFDRYQSRVLWLLPFAATAAAWRWSEAQRAADPPARPLVPAG